VRVEETKPAEVGRLLMLNLSKQPVLVPAGAVLKGGAQTRIVASPVLLLGQSVHHIDVRCVERGRWTPHAPAPFSKVHSSPMSIKRRKMERDITSRLDSGIRAPDQHATWVDVDRYLASRDCLSATSSLADSFEAPSENAGARGPQVSIDLAGAAGLAVFDRRGRLLTWEVFGTPGLASGGVEFILEGIREETGFSPVVRGADPALAKAFSHSRSALMNPSAMREEPGAGGTMSVVDFAAAAADLQGSAVVFEASVLHLAVTSAEAGVFSG
jgi:hypothetical protein